MDPLVVTAWLISVGVFILGPIFGLYWATRSETVKDLVGRFDSPQGRYQIRRQIAHVRNPPDYILILAGFLETIQRRFGVARWPLKLFAALLTLAFVYGIFLFTVSWVLGGSGKLGNAELLPTTSMRLTDRLVSIVAVFGTSVYFLTRSYGVIVAKLVRWKNSLNRYLGLAADIGIIIASSTVCFGAAALLLAADEAQSLGIFALLVALANGIRSFAPFIIAATVALTSSIILCVSFALTSPAGGLSAHFVAAFEAALGAGLLLFLSLFFVGMIITAGRRWRFFKSPVLWTGPIVVLIGAITLMRSTFATNAPSNEALSVVPFWLALPVVNAIADFASILISLWILKKVIALNNQRWTALFIALDWVIAVFFSVLSKILIVVSVEVAGRIINVGPSNIYDMRDLLQTAATAPFSPETAWLTGMVLTPLLPSLANLLLLVMVAIDRSISPEHHLRMASLTLPSISKSSPAQDDKRFWIAFYLANRQYMRFAILGLAAAIALGVLALAISHLLPDISKALSDIVLL